MACYVINQNKPEARNRGECAPRLEDYYECLHHKKEVWPIRLSTCKTSANHLCRSEHEHRRYRTLYVKQSPHAHERTLLSQVRYEASD